MYLRSWMWFLLFCLLITGCSEKTNPTDKSSSSESSSTSHTESSESQSESERHVEKPNLSRALAKMELAGVITQWARAEGLSEGQEKIYRQTVAKACNAESWEMALINIFNDTHFSAWREVGRILNARLSQEAILELQSKAFPESDIPRALQSFLKSFGYFPETPEEYRATVIIYKLRSEMLPETAKLAKEWSKKYGYKFNIRDFNLLSRMNSDSLRRNLNRQELVREINKSLQPRKHVKHKPRVENDYKEEFFTQVDELSIVDVWNIQLLDELLSRPRTQMSIRWIAKGDLVDLRTAWGGLVFYQKDRAEAHYYPADPAAKPDDMVIHPSERFVIDGYDSMCRFICHFDKIENADRAGPTPEELADAKRNNYYGLVMTRTGKKTFCAHYYNPQGKVVSLGEFPIR